MQHPTFKVRPVFLLKTFRKFQSPTTWQQRRKRFY